VTPAADRGCVTRGWDRSSRELVVDAVARYEPADEREDVSKRVFLEELARLRTPFDRAADPVHVTASALVVSSRGVVLHRHRRMGRWLQPGGHVDAGESPAEAAQRETAEETGLVASHPAAGPLLAHLDVHPAPPGHLHLDLRYLLLAPAVDPTPGPGESPDVRWFSWEDAESLADEGLLGALRRVRRLLDSEGSSNVPVVPRGS
jgi:8-oxo-dGTP pyrophosphatase MutT (NUDIX family)